MLIQLTDDQARILAQSMENEQDAGGCSSAEYATYSAILDQIQKPRVLSQDELTEICVANITAWAVEEYEANGPDGVSLEQRFLESRDSLIEAILDAQGPILSDDLMALEKAGPHCADGADAATNSDTPLTMDALRTHQQRILNTKTGDFTPIFPPLVQQRARETATILAALRMWQAEAVGVRDELPYDDIATDNFTLEALTSAEIDALCERLNQ